MYEYLFLPVIPRIEPSTLHYILGPISYHFLWQAKLLTI